MKISQLNENKGQEAESDFKEYYTKHKNHEGIEIPVFYEQLSKVKLSSVKKVSDTRRDEGRKELAKQAKKLLTSLGIKGVSVTAPNYSMAQSVHVKIPSVSVKKRNDSDYRSFSEMGEDEAPRVANTLRHRASVYVEQILMAGFPNTDNRSDTNTDYFDYIWSIS